MNYDSVVYCKINGRATIACCHLENSKEANMVFHDLINGKKYLKRDYHNIKKKYIEEAQITDVRPLRGLLTEKEIKQCITSPNVELYVEDKLSR